MTKQYVVSQYKDMCCGWIIFQSKTNAEFFGNFSWPTKRTASHPTEDQLVSIQMATQAYPRVAALPPSRGNTPYGHTWPSQSKPLLNAISIIIICSHYNKMYV